MSAADLGIICLTVAIAAITIFAREIWLWTSGGLRLIWAIPIRSSDSISRESRQKWILNFFQSTSKLGETFFPIPLYAPALAFSNRVRAEFTVTSRLSLSKAFSSRLCELLGVGVAEENYSLLLPPRDQDVRVTAHDVFISSNMQCVDNRVLQFRDIIREDKVQNVHGSFLRTFAHFSRRSVKDEISDCSNISDELWLCLSYELYAGSLLLATRAKDHSRKANNTSSDRYVGPCVFARAVVPIGMLDQGDTFDVYNLVLNALQRTSTLQQDSVDADELLFMASFVERMGGDRLSIVGLISDAKLHRTMLCLTCKADRSELTDRPDLLELGQEINFSTHLSAPGKLLHRLWIEAEAVRANAARDLDNPTIPVTAHPA